MKILVTGSSGFFGSGIVSALRDSGHIVQGAARRVGAGTDVALDITDRAACAGVLGRGFDAVVHCAALAHVRMTRDAERTCFEVNVRGAANMAEAAASAGVGRYIFISSVMVYGEHSLPDAVDEDAPLAARGVYGLAKIAGERATHDAPGDMQRSILRMASMYAPDWLLNVRKRVEAPLGGRWLQLVWDENAPRHSLCSRAGGAGVVRGILESRLAAGTYNVADDHVYTQAEIGAAVTRADGRRARVRIPGIVPTAALRAADLAPPSLRDAIRARVWKFCGRNVYSTSRLAAAGIRLPASLLQIA